jgi:lipopolysaccharide/colanic/teichoic acid biosynthesis glycosyltransferase
MSRQKQDWFLILSLILLDVLCLVSAFCIAYVLRNSGDFWSSKLTLYPEAAYVVASGLTLPLWLGMAALARLYHPAHLLGGVDEYSAVVKANTLGVALLVIVSFLLHSTSTVARGWVALVWVSSIVLMVGARFLFRRMIYRLRRHGFYVERAAIAGVSDQAEALAAQLGTDGSSGLQVVGFLDDYLPIGTPVGNGLLVLGSPCTIDCIAHDWQISQVVVLPNALTWESFQHIVSCAGGPRNGYEVKLVPSFYELLTTGVEISHRSSVPLMSVNRARITGVDAALKLGVDYALGGALLTLSAPLIGLIALVLRMTGSGQVFQRTPVLSQNYTPFHIFTFRGGATAGNALERWLYCSHMRKLPQLFNVMAGQLSLVGPRPIPQGLEQHYASWLPSLLSVRPGITGPWAVQCRLNASLEEEMYQTVYYIRKWTIWLDLQILFQSLMRDLREYASRVGWAQRPTQPVEPVREATDLTDASVMVDHRSEAGQPPPAHAPETTRLSSWVR